MNVRPRKPASKKKHNSQGDISMRPREPARKRKDNSQGDIQLCGNKVHDAEAYRSIPTKSLDIQIKDVITISASWQRWPKEVSSSDL